MSGCSPWGRAHLHQELHGGLDVGGGLEVRRAFRAIPHLEMDLLIDR